MSEEEQHSVDLLCPENMLFVTKKILAGEYNIPGTYEIPPRILDIGANCGAFSIWASIRWPGAQVFAYEPAAKIFELLCENVKAYPRVTPLKFAVLASDRTQLFSGKDNCGQASFYPELQQTADDFETPEILHPQALPEAEILKVDAEGCEYEIISALLREGRKFDIIMFEYHGDDERIRLDELIRTDYLLTGGEIICPHRGTLKYKKRQQQ